MSDGLEIDMLSIGNADSIVVTSWYGGRAVRILIDGGNPGNASDVLAFLRSRGISILDHVVASHPHDDHAGGLADIVSTHWLQVGTVWMHKPWAHVDMARVESALSRTAATATARCIRESIQTVRGLAQAASLRAIPVVEPFRGTTIDCLTVAGPSLPYYEQLVHQFGDENAIRAIEADRVAYDSLQLWESMQSPIGPVWGQSLLDDPRTSPENSSSVILATQRNGGDRYLFTADAGVEALCQAASAYDLGTLAWMQLPHHGSRRNLNAKLIDHFRPRTAFVSAKGSRKHPRTAVINAFKALGTRVFSTHYPNGANLWHSTGSIPSRIDYGPATALWE